MVRVERNPAFWQAIASSLTETVAGLSPEFVGAACQGQSVLPLASERGGFLFIRLDPAGFVCELHTLYHPSAWSSREIPQAAREAFNAVFILGFQVVTTLEVQANRHSQPPKSFGFVQCGDWRESPAGMVRMWTLNRLAWEASPANRRARKSLN